jgi:hypothetical protein
MHACRNWEKGNTNLEINDMELWNSMNEGKHQLEEYNSLLEQVIQKSMKGEGELRFGNPFIKASDIASQYFCEKKVEMQHLHDEIETERKTLGTEAHEKLLEDSVKIKRKDLWKEIYREKPVFALEMPLLAKYKNLILAGQPDSVLFMRGLPLVISEYQFRSQRDYLSYHVQARTYGMLLKSMGFDVSKLFYAIVVADLRAKDDDQLKVRVVDTILKNRRKETVLTTENAVIYLKKFNPNEAEQNLDWAIELWKEQREAIPTRNQNKCRSCEYKTECDACSLF